MLKVVVLELEYSSGWANVVQRLLGSAQDRTLNHGANDSGIWLLEY